MSEQNRDDMTYGNEELSPAQEDALRASLTDTYQAPEPSDRLLRRVQEMATTADRKPVRSFPVWRSARIGWSFMILFLVLGAYGAYRWLFNRSGEAAVQLIPQNAMLVLTVDLAPSPNQVALYRRIDQAIKNAGLQTEIDQAITSGLENSPVGKEVRPYVAKSLALALIDPSAQPHFDKVEPVIFLKVENTGKVNEILTKYGTRGQVSGLTYYGFKKDNINAAIIGDYLVLSPVVNLLDVVNRTFHGQINSVAYLHEYQTARAALPEDANMMLFLSPTALATLDQESKQLGINPLRQTQWLALSATLRDQGIVFNYRWPMDSGKLQGLRAMASIAPIEEEAYKRLPSGAYGLMAISQPSKYWTFVEDALNSEGGARQEFEKGMAEFEKETGISVPRDILPALNGTLWLAVYPDPAKPDGAQGVMILDEQQEANPAALADKVKAYLERTTAKNGKPGVRFIAEQRNGATFWHLDEASSKQLSSELAGAFGGEQHSAKGKSGVHVTVKADEGDDMTVTYAQVGRAVLIASSETMLERAVAAYQGQGQTLADDPAISAMRQNAVPGSQSVLMINLASIMEKLRPTLEKSMKDSPVTADDVIRLFGNPDNGLVVSGLYDGRIATGSMFLPLNYEVVVQLLSQGAKVAEGMGAGAGPKGFDPNSFDPKQFESQGLNPKELEELKREIEKATKN